MIPHNHAEHRALSLNEVSANFEQWRATRTKKSKIPHELWQQAIPLLKKYGKSKICHALKLNGGQFNAKIKLYQSVTTQSTPKVATFVPVSIPPISELAEPSLPAKLEIKRADGAVIAIEGLTQKILSQILNQFMAGLSC